MAKKQHIVYIERIPTHSDWIIYVLLICMILLAILRARFPFRFSRFINLTFQTNFLKLYSREIYSRHLFSFISSFFYIFSTSFILYLCIHYFFLLLLIIGFNI